MKVNCILLLSVLCIHFSHAKAQNSKDMVVRVNYGCLDFEKVNDGDQRQFEFVNILNERGRSELDVLLKDYPKIRSFKVDKIFPHLTTKDTVSIARTGERVTIPPFWATFQMHVPESVDFIQFQNALNKAKVLIHYAHPDYTVTLTSVPNDSLYFKQFALNESMAQAHINIEDAWDIETGKPWIKVAVHDNGIDSTNTDLRLLTGGGYNGTDFPENEWGNGGFHGTPVAGIIGARRNNNIGIAGVAGGDGTDSTGVSLIDMKVAFNGNLPASYFMASVVDAARSVGSYWSYPESNNSDLSGYYQYARGYGAHIGNHSYTIKAELPLKEEKIDDIGNTVSVGNCAICREAFLFSMRNGVVNVVARGNSHNATPSNDPMYIGSMFPQQLPDGWVISVGASGADGITVQEGLNQSQREDSIGYWSLYGENMDLIAPGSDSIVFSTAQNQSAPYFGYDVFNGTSAAAPYVSGVAALLLSHYNYKDCYSNRNLSLEDVEYILEHAATDVLNVGYDEISGWGRLNAKEALSMIDYPLKQIVHPDSLIASNVVARDTIVLAYQKYVANFNWGPISTPWPLEQDREYQVERIRFENTYSIEAFIQPSTEVLDVWARPSVSNAIGYFEDTVRVYKFFVPGNANFIDTTYEFDVFNLDPFDTIVEIDMVAKTVKTQGYYYHFINKIVPLPVPVFGDPATWGPDSIILDTPEDYWYPVNPFTNGAYLPFSLYLKDSMVTSVYDFPCDSLNDLIDEHYTLEMADEQLEWGVVYPNPFQEKLTVDFGERKGEKHLVMRCLNGKIIEEHNTLEQTYTINTKEIAQGLYLLGLMADGELHTFKIIKQ